MLGIGNRAAVQGHQAQGPSEITQPDYLSKTKNGTQCAKLIAIPSGGISYGSEFFGESLVNQYLEVLSASLITFAVTNIDDAFLLTLFFARRIPRRRIIAGQYLGFAVIIIVSLIGALAALAIPQRWIRLLGLLPLALGIKDLFKAHRKERAAVNDSRLGVLSIALITLSNGGDNIGVYVPFFVLGRSQLWLILIVYTLLIGLWCFLGSWLGTRSLTLRLAERWAQKAVPLIFIFLGIFILTRR